MNGPGRVATPADRWLARLGPANGVIGALGARWMPARLVGRWSYLVRLTVIGVAYYGCAKGGLALAFGTKQVTAVWPPTGLALAAMLIWGRGMWPGVAAGAFFANLTTSEPLLSALGIMVGNTLEALLGACLLSRIAGFRCSLARKGDVIWLVGIGAVISTLVSATVGVLSLWAGGLLPGFVWSVWKTWWLGDMGGDLLVAPALLVLAGVLRAGTPARLERWRIGEVIVVFGGLIVLAVWVFSSGGALPYVLFPVLFWIALRLRQPGAVVSSLLLSGIAVYFTAHGHGPFVGGSPDESLLRAQTFVGVVALTALLVAAVNSEREQAEGELVLSERVSAELERRVEQRTQELVAANRELEAFSYSVSHDLRAPLRAIDGFSKAVINRYGDVLDEPGVELLGRVRAATQRMSALIDELLMLSRLTRKQMRRQPVDLSAIAREQADDLLRHAPDRVVDWRIDDGLVVQGDAELLRTMLQNLLENAWKFTAPRAKARIQLTRAGEGDCLELAVIDNGVGFDMEFADKLFRPFERLHRQEEFPGNGVGLTTVARIVHRHGGSVRAHARVEEGATFYIELPKGTT